jgi:PAS domain S-box-containing protein
MINENNIIHKLKLLLVEDDAGDRMMICKAIQDCGIETEIKFAENVEDALTMTSIQTFDCILLDFYFYNNANGFEFIKAFHGRGGDAPIIMITSFNEPALVVESMKLGVADYIAKKDITPECIAKSFLYIMRLRAAEANRILAEKSLFESELRLKTIVERSPVIVFTIDNNGYFKLFKGKGAKALNIASESIIGHNIKDIWKELPIRLSDYETALKEGNFQCQVEVNNHHFDINFISVKNHNQKSGSIMGVAIDITDFKKNEEELLNTIEITEAAANIKEQFLANMSHEIRTPIHGIISLVNFLLNTKVDKEQQKYLALTAKSADNLLSIVNDILDLSKIEAGKMNIEEIPFNIREIIGTCVDILSAKANEKNLKVEVLIEKEIPETIIGDPVRLMQVLNNLVGNAIKFTEKGEVKIICTTIESNSQSCMLQFKVKDTGIGIAAVKLPNVFESFTQASSDTSRKYGGTGLGLTIARKLIEQQSGNIVVESEIDKGTTFTFSLPYKISNIEITSPRTNPDKLINMNHLNILIAEDNDINRFIIEKMISPSGAKLSFTKNGEETVRAVTQEYFDLILMDIEMPGINGYQATEMIRKELKSTNIPIIAMTGHAMEGEKAKCIESGMNDYISKPFQASDLSSIILKWTSEIKNIQQTAVLENSASSMIPATHINLDFLKEISDGNEAFFKEFIQLFLTSAPKTIEEMQKWHSESNWENLRQISHKIKPSFNYIGLKELNQAAAKIEEYSRKQENLNEIPALIEKIRSTCNYVYQELENEIKAGLTV